MVIVRVNLVTVEDTAPGFNVTPIIQPKALPGAKPIRIAIVTIAPVQRVVTALDDSPLAHGFIVPALVLAMILPVSLVVAGRILHVLKVKIRLA